MGNIEYLFCSSMGNCQEINKPVDALKLAYFPYPRGNYYFLRFQNTTHAESGAEIPITVAYSNGLKEPDHVYGDIGVDCFLIGNDLQEALSVDPYDYDSLYHDRKYAIIFQGQWIGEIEDGSIATMDKILKVIPIASSGSA